MTEKISNELYDAVQKLNRYMHRNRHRALNTKEGIHRGRMKLLYLISKNDGIIQRDLAEMLDMRPSSLTEMISNLEKSSLVRREKDENDGRVMHVFLTDEGKKIIDNFIKAKDNMPDTVFNSLTVEEKEKMLELVNKVNLNLETIDTKEDVIEYKSIKPGFCHKGHKRNHRKHGRADKFNNHRENKRRWF